MMGRGTDIGIVGGSIAGCAAAVELSRAGCPVTVYERSGEQLKDRGAGIGVPRQVIETFVERDLVDGDLPYFPVESFLRICRDDRDPRHGRIAWDQPITLAALNWGALYRNLRARVPEGSYQTHRQAVALHGHDGGYNGKPAAIDFADGGRVEADVVVCADGYSSLGRATLFPELAFDYAGYVLWRGALDEAALEDSGPLERGIHCVGYTGGHGIFYFVPGVGDSVARGERLVNWGMYLPLPASELAAFLTDASGTVHAGSLPPGSMPPATEMELKHTASVLLPAYYADLVDRSEATFVYAIYDCEVPAYCRGRVCLAGDAGAFARPHSGAGALKGTEDAIALAAALAQADDLDLALAAWSDARTAANNELVRFGNQLGDAFVTNIPDWSGMSEASIAEWYRSSVTIPSAYLRTSR